MKKLILFCLITCMLLACTSCSNKAPVSVRPDLIQMKSICELATLECYYHNVAKALEEDVYNFLWISKDRNFWIEFGGKIKVGIDANLVSMTVDDNVVTITIPEAKVLQCSVDEASLNEHSYIVAEGSAEVKVQDTLQALTEATQAMQQSAAQDRVLLVNAQLRAQVLLEEYVKNIGSLTGTEYTIVWEYLSQSPEEIPAVIPAA